MFQNKVKIILFLISMCIFSSFSLIQAKSDIVVQTLQVGNKTVSLELIENKSNKKDFLLKLKKDSKVLDTYLIGNNEGFENVEKALSEFISIGTVNLDSDDDKEVAMFFNQGMGGSSYSTAKHSFFKIKDDRLICLGYFDGIVSKNTNVVNGIINTPFIRALNEYLYERYNIGYLGLEGSLYTSKNEDTLLGITENYVVENNKLLRIPAVVLNNKNLVLRTKQQKSKNFISVIDIAQKLGYTIKYDSNKGSIKLSNKTENITLRLGSNIANINSKSVILTSNPTELLNCTMVNVADLPKLFKVETKWIGDHFQLILINTVTNTKSTSKNLSFKELLKQGIVSNNKYQIGQSINIVYKDLGIGKKYGFQTIKVTEYLEENMAIFHDDKNIIGFRFNGNQNIYGISKGNTAKDIVNKLGPADWEFDPRQADLDELMPENSPYSMGYKAGKYTLTIYFDTNYKVQYIYVM